MKFLNSYTVRDRNSKQFSETGTAFDDKMILKMVDGVPELEKVGTIPRYAMIQSHRESTDLAYILDRIDATALNNYTSTYTVEELLDGDIIDFTNLPKSQGDLLNVLTAGKQIFDGLPQEVREAFNYSHDRFISSFGSDEFVKTMEQFRKPININDLNKEREVMTDE